MDLDILNRQINQDCGLHRNGPIVVGVSGGADSLVLLHLLNQMTYDLTAVYVDHGLRTSSMNDGEHVREICKAWNIPFLGESVDVNSHVLQNKLSIEEASRNLRYKKLFAIADQLRAQAVAVAHHADDQVETVLMHLLRGSGMSGLRGMAYRTIAHPWHAAIPIVRPLLQIWKSEIETYCQMFNIMPVLDESNLDLAFFRNRIRHALIPELANYNPEIKAGLLRLGTLLKDDYEVLLDLTEKEAEKVEMSFNQDQVTFLSSPFQKLPISIQRMLLRKAIAYLQPTMRDISFDSIERGVNAINIGNPTIQTDLLKGLILFLDQARIVIMDKQKPYRCEFLPYLSPPVEKKCAIGEICVISPEWCFLAEQIKEIDYTETAPEAFCVHMDADICGNEIWIRLMKAGDRMAPIGLGGHLQKVSDILINQKISRWIRPAYPLVWNANEIVWLPGYRVAESVKIKPETRRVLQLKFFANPRE
jgi:tRNA(Ile)-lysidine synthase